jgi:hypothetical protein
MNLPNRKTIGPFPTVRRRVFHIQNRFHTVRILVSLTVSPVRYSSTA